jgi:DNA-binding response OmpR family regulator
MKTLLLVEDELNILENNRRFFEGEGYSVLLAGNLARAREHLAREAPGAIVLDIMLPDGNGLDLLKELRETGSKIPIIMLTAWNKSSDVARGLKLGANDYVSKPFTYEVLQARMEAMFRNVGQVPDLVEKGPLKLDMIASQAFLNGLDMLLTQKEFSLLLLFAQNEGRMLGAEYLYEKAWGQPMNEDANKVRAQISRLRKKLSGSGYTIAVEYGEGYRLEKEPQDKEYVTD